MVFQPIGSVLLLGGPVCLFLMASNRRSLISVLFYPLANKDGDKLLFPRVPVVTVTPDCFIY